LTLLGFVVFSIIQHQDSIDALKLAKISSDSSDVATKKSIALTERSIAVADSSNGMTQQGLELSRKRFVIENRPYVGIKTITLDTFEIGEKYCITIIVQNYGKTPALGLYGFNACETHTIPSYDVFKHINEIRGTKTISVLPPSETSRDQIFSDNVLGEREYQTIINKGLLLYAYGMIYYSDLFNGQYTTSYCSIYYIDSKTFGSSPLGNTMK
jgi:hypothetical protein